MSDSAGLSDLPLEITCHILGFLNPESLVLFGSSCKDWREFLLSYKGVESEGDDNLNAEIVWKEVAFSNLGKHKPKSAATWQSFCVTNSKAVRAFYRNQKKLRQQQKKLPAVAVNKSIVSFVTLLVKSNLDQALRTLFSNDPTSSISADTFKGAFPSPLHEAAKNGFVEVAEVLVQSGFINVNAKEKVSSGPTALEIACTKGNVEVAELILKQFSGNGGMMIEDSEALSSLVKSEKDFNSILIKACSGGHTTLVAELIRIGEESGREVKDIVNLVGDASRHPKQTPLISAVRGRKLDMAKHLIKLGADLKAVEGRRQNAVTLAVAEGNLTMLQMFDEVRSEELRQLLATPVPLACEKSDCKNKYCVVELLKGRGKARTITTTDFTMDKAKEIFEWLVERKAVELGSWRKQALYLSFAIADDDAEMVEYLLQKFTDWELEHPDEIDTTYIASEMMEVDQYDGTTQMEEQEIHKLLLNPLYASLAQVGAAYFKIELEDIAIEKDRRKRARQLAMRKKKGRGSSVSKEMEEEEIEEDDKEDGKTKTKLKQVPASKELRENRWRILNMIMDYGDQATARVKTKQERFRSDETLYHCCSNYTWCFIGEISSMMDENKLIEVCQMLFARYYEAGPRVKTIPAETINIMCNCLCIKTLRYLMQKVKELDLRIDSMNQLNTVGRLSQEMNHLPNCDKYSRNFVCKNEVSGVLVGEGEGLEKYKVEVDKQGEVWYDLDGWHREKKMAMLKYTKELNFWQVDSNEKECLAVADSVEVAKYLVEDCGADVNHCLPGRDTVLISSLDADRPTYELVKYLLDKGANPNATREDNRRNVLYALIIQGSKNMQCCRKDEPLIALARLIVSGVDLLQQIMIPDPVGVLELVPGSVLKAMEIEELDEFNSRYLADQVFRDFFRHCYKKVEEKGEEGKEEVKKMCGEFLERFEQAVMDHNKDTRGDVEQWMSERGVAKTAKTDDKVEEEEEKVADS